MENYNWPLCSDHRPVKKLSTLALFVFTQRVLEQLNLFHYRFPKVSFNFSHVKDMLQKEKHTEHICNLLNEDE